MKHLILYSSKDCCLCDDALHLLEQIKLEFPLAVDKIDIYQDKALLIKYRVRIPVLKDENTESELGWPFTLGSLRHWLSSFS